MQVTLKTLQQQTFKIDIDPEETVRAAGSAGQGRTRTGRGELGGPPGLGGGRRGGARGPRLSSEQGPAARLSGVSPLCTRENAACVGLGHRVRPAGSGRRQGSGSRPG